jgi:hypothetical protein
MTSSVSTSIVLAVLLLYTTSCNAADPASTNACTLKNPPSVSGELFLESGTVKVEGRIYPRLSELPARHTGCQVMWATINGRSSRTVVHVRSGKVESVEPEPLPPLCAKGERTADTGCTSRARSLQVSFPSGCTAHMVAGKVSKECMASFMNEHVLLDTMAEE